MGWDREIEMDLWIFGGVFVFPDPGGLGALVFFGLLRAGRGEMIVIIGG